VQRENLYQKVYSLVSAAFQVTFWKTDMSD
jgi:hypothetical protein